MGFFSGREVSDRLGLNQITRVVCLLALATVAIGCQSGPPTVSNRTLIAHLPGIDFSGLKPIQPVESVSVSCSPPDKWKALHLEKNALYSHQQWKAPSGYTGVGVLHAHLPLPVSAKTLLWFAKLEYAKKTNNAGQALGEWTDALGRPWFEAENEKYHVRGYAMTDGCDAWVVYFGYKVNRPPNTDELNLAARCVDTVVPHTGEQPAHDAAAEAKPAP